MPTRGKVLRETTESLKKSRGKINSLLLGQSTQVTDYCWKICFVIFSVKYLYYPFSFSGILSTDRFLSLARVVSQCSGYARFELQVYNIPHWEEDIIY